MSTEYLERTVSEMGALLVGIATSTVELASGSSLDRYDRCRKRHQALTVLLGPLPRFLEEDEDGWAFWNRIRQLKTYQERREFIAEHYTQPYQARLQDRASVPMEQALAQRDLVIEDEIGRGGFGVVYRARHVALDADRAVKVFDPSFFSGKDTPLRRFAREAKLLARLTHPNIVRFFDAGIAGKHPFIVTQYIAAPNLQTLVAKQGVLPESTVSTILETAALALHHAHENKVFHRDIKPSNLLWHEGHVTVLDLGAGVAVQETLTTRLTTGVLGTPGFIAPELFDDPTLATPGQDVYSLGITAHYLLTGKLPFPADARKYLLSADVSTELSDVILQCIRAPEDRFQTAAELAEAVQSIF